MNRKLFIKCICGYGKILTIKYNKLGYEVVVVKREERKKLTHKLPFIIDENGVTEL